LFVKTPEIAKESGSVTKWFEKKRRSFFVIPSLPDHATGRAGGRRAAGGEKALCFL